MSRLFSSLSRHTVSKVLRPSMAASFAPVSAFAAQRSRFHNSARRSAPQAAAAASAKPAMNCYQCEQTRDTVGCKTVGVCGKDHTTSNLQDLIAHVCKGVSVYAHAARQVDASASSQAVDQYLLKALFATMTNVNFDQDRMVGLLKEGDKMRAAARDLYVNACKKAGKQPDAAILNNEVATMQLAGDKAAMEEQGKECGIDARKARYGEDIVSLVDLNLFGVKGTCAYAEHAMIVGAEAEEVYAGLHRAMSILAGPTFEVGTLVKLAGEVGAVNLKVMDMLDAQHKKRFGVPEPTTVSCKPRPGKAILVSGHDMEHLMQILEQTKDTGINVYTHGELLPANSYPQFKKYKHLAGNYGGPWQLQKFEFAAFPGAIVMTTNCLVEPLRSYKHRIFTTSVTGFPGVKHIENHNYKAVIDAAQNEEGFTEDDAETMKAATRKDLLVGFGADTIMSVADKVVAGVKAGAIKRFFVIGGCDGSEGERNYFTEVAANTGKDSVILTLGCGKYRFNRMDLGDIGGIPRVLDLGQCNNAIDGVKVAVALAKAFNTDVNSLPLSFAVSWFEQKAVAVLLSLLSLGIKNIRLGPNLPGFVSPNVLNVLVKEYNIQPTNVKDPMADLKMMNQGK